MFKKIVQLNKRGVEMGSYFSIVEASQKTGVQASSISNTLSGLYTTAGGYYWKWKGVDKRLFKKQKTLSIDEYIYLHDLTYASLAKIVGLRYNTLKEINKRSYGSVEAQKKLIEFGINPRCRVDPKEYVYIDDEEQPQGLEEYVIDVLSRKKIGVFKCMDSFEGKEISDILKKEKVIHYGLQKGAMYYVKYDMTI